ncbi:MAG: hypothetical protein ABIT96_06290 [Ferruginibacter sp.]
MENNVASNDRLNVQDFDKPEMPSGLNVVTILTIIGCVIQFFISIFSYFSAKTTFENKDETLAKINSGNMPAFMKSLMGDMSHFDEMVTNSFNNRLPILIFSLVATILCLVGVIQMRALKNQGYLLYIIGELLPFVSLIAFIGTFSLAGTGFYVGFGIALLFIIIYTSYRKNLVY